MPAPRILFVKLSSLGDVIHNLPAVSDVSAHRPDLEIGWAVEEPYADLVALHPAVRYVIPVGLRALRRSPFRDRGRPFVGMQAAFPCSRDGGNGGLSLESARCVIRRVPQEVTCALPRSPPSPLPAP